MTSKLVLDNIAGRTTAGSITIVGEGNSTTTNLQQGLAKAWAGGADDGTTINDSFNITSRTDEGTGNYDYTVTNAFSAQIDDGGVGGMCFGGARVCRGASGATTTSVIDIVTNTSSSGSAVDSVHGFTIHGDLA
tara:strand:+ start:202 stop:603 length:402 start_codon:yes stop_codon:yes gene_type:complete